VNPPAAGASAPKPPPAAPSASGDAGASPGLAFLLGLIPGVGAIYNGQYAKGLVHVFIFGLLLSIGNSDVGHRELEPIFILITMGFYAYMPFEAYHTARRRMRGEVVDEFSSIIPIRGGTGFPVAPVLMIALGVVFLLHNLDLLHIGQLLRYWPVFLIGLGAYMLYVRLTDAARDSDPMNRQEIHHEP
jgi:TM2 domain-containing membrane protein YozV